MKLLVNLISIKSGGGQQVASNFIRNAAEFNDYEIYYLVTRGTEVHQLLISLGHNKFWDVPNSTLQRFLFTAFKLRKQLKASNIHVIYTLFGPGIKFKGTLSITGCAYSNIFFPEIKFWQTKNVIQMLRHWAIDHYRKSSTLKSDAIIFENAAMRERSVTLFNYPRRATKLILPSISDYGEIQYNAEIREKLSSIPEHSFCGLFLANWHPNKNLAIIPDILYELKIREMNDVYMIVTVPPSHPKSIKLIQRASELKVDEKIIFVGTIKPNEVPALIQRSSSLFLLSLLESFSNNIIEAWYFNKPLFISDEEWARSICHDAAIFVQRTSPADIAEKIIAYRDLKDKQPLHNSVQKLLKHYPNPKEKVRQQLQFIKSICNEQ